MNGPDREDVERETVVLRLNSVHKTQEFKLEASVFPVNL